MNREAIHAAVEAADNRTHSGKPAHIHERTFIDVPDPAPEPTPPARVPSAQPVPTDGTASTPEPHGGGTTPPDTTFGFDVARIVDRVQSGTPSLAGYRDSPATVKHR